MQLSNISPFVNMLSCSCDSLSLESLVGTNNGYKILANEG